MIQSIEIILKLMIAFHNNPVKYYDKDGRVAGWVITGMAAAVFVCARPQAVAANSRYNSHGDKFRHCWTSCRIAKVCGAQIAMLAGLGYEGKDSLIRIFVDLGLIKDTTGIGDWSDSLKDLIANNKCIPWESHTIVGGWVGSALRESCECCCTREVGTGW